jgi:hypothetical protein
MEAVPGERRWTQREERVRPHPRNYLRQSWSFEKRSASWGKADIVGCALSPGPKGPARISLTVPGKSDGEPTGVDPFLKGGALNAQSA